MFPVADLALFWSGIHSGFAESAVFRDENHVDLGERVIQRAVVEAQEVVSNKTRIVHRRNNFKKFRTIDHSPEQRNFQSDRFRLSQRPRGPTQDLQLGALHIELEEIRASKPLFPAQLVHCHDRNGPGNAINRRSFYFAQKRGPDFVGMHVKDGCPRGFPRGGENVLGVLSPGADLPQERLELRERLDEQQRRVGEIGVKLRRGAGHARVDDRPRLKTKPRQLREAARQRRALGLRRTVPPYLQPQRMEEPRHGMFRLEQGAHGLRAIRPV